MRGRSRHVRGLRVVLAALVAVPVVTAGAPAVAASDSVACRRPALGFMGPITGSGAFIGKEQLGFARYAARLVGRKRVRLVEADTRLQPRRAAAEARRLHADPNVLAVVGPAASREVLAVAPIFGRGSRLAFVSGSALGAALTNGSIPSFFRVVPSEAAQARTIAVYVRTALRAARVVAVDDGSAYSRALADEVHARLRARGVAVRRESVAGHETARFAAAVARVSPRTDVVFLPWRVARDAQLFGRELRRQGRGATIVGSDGLDSGDFTIPGSYVAAFAPDVRSISGNDAFLRGYGDRFISNFGPPVYVATQAALVAIRRACADGRATRGEVERFLRRTSLPRTVLGRPLRFTPHGDAAGARFAVFRLGAKGEKTLVR